MSSTEDAIFWSVIVLIILVTFYWMYWISKTLKMSFFIVFIISIFTGGLGLLVLTAVAVTPENQKLRAASKKRKN